MAISFNADRTRAQVAEMRNIAREMKNSANNEMQNALESTKTNWKGEAADAFYLKCQVLQNNVKREASNIEDLANRYELLARAIEEAERKAAEVLKTFGGGN